MIHFGSHTSKLAPRPEIAGQRIAPQPDAGGGNERPYQALAARYDAVMEHVNHMGWAAYVEKLWKLHGLNPKRLLETGAGTCRLAPYLAKKGRRHVATDLSHPMLWQGLHRAREIACCDFRALPFKDKSFDAVLCLYDAVNYCLERSDLDRFFAEAERVLMPGGSLLADVTTATNSRRHFLDTTSHEELDGVHVVRRSWYETDERIQHNDFHFFSPNGDGTFRLEREEHSQRVWALKEFDRASAAAGLVRVAAYDDDYSTSSATSERIHLLFMKPKVRRGK
ncbi:MAG: class I SAM-dependent methyltransferase [Fibrobacterota bacterium]